MISNHAPSATRSPLHGQSRAPLLKPSSPESVVRATTDPAERVGVEPTVPLRIHLISNQAPSATRSSLRGGLWQRRSPLSTLEEARATQIGDVTPCRGRSRRRARSGGSAPVSGLRRTRPPAPRGRWPPHARRTRRAPPALGTTS